MTNAVYYVIGGDPEYIKMLEMSIYSLRYWKENNDIDIIIMSDESYIDFLKTSDIILKNTNLIILNSKPSNIIHTCMNKITILEYYDDIYNRNYEKLLYLDCDIIVTGSLHKLFDYINTPNMLYVKYEGAYTPDVHKLHWFSLNHMPYTDQELEEFVERKQCVFNTGHYGFLVSTEIKKHFDNIIKLINKSVNEKFFYEQSFMNYYFNKNNLVKYDLPYISLYSCIELKELDKNSILHHFLGSQINWQLKYSIMKKYFYNFIEST